MLIDYVKCLSNFIEIVDSSFSIGDSSCFSELHGTQVVNIWEYSEFFIRINAELLRESIPITYKNYYKYYYIGVF